MFQQLSAGLALALFTLVLPNSTNFAQPDLPLHLLHQVEASANDPQWGGDGAAATVADVSVGKDDGALLIQHEVLYLQRVTAYNAVPDQTNSDPDIAACGPNRPDQIALSQDLFFRKNGGNRCGEPVAIVLRSGRVIHGVVWDTMNPRYHMAADILMGSVSKALDFGVKEAELRFLQPRQPAASRL
ncbi:MAG: hypothetical protein ACP5MM_00870 [Acidithiobacillus sp.]|uniref:hypothetical protein n=1 Tax=Acidithiobacillus sp. TaxID=1872118 RepID=UPI003D0292E1